MSEKLKIGGYDLEVIIKDEFEGFRTLLKKNGIDYEPQRGYWEGFARLFDSSAREYVKEQAAVTRQIQLPVITWEDVKAIVEIAEDLLPDPRYKRDLDASFQTEEAYYTEVLKRFKEGKV